MKEPIILKADTNYDFINRGDGMVEMREWESDTKRGFDAEPAKLLGILRPSPTLGLVWRPGPTNSKDVTNEWTHSTQTWKQQDK